MRCIFPINDVARLYVSEAQSEARNSTGSFSFHGRSLFSYAMLIARRYETYRGKVYLVTSQKRSITTSGHVSTICSHLTWGDAREKVIHVPYLDLDREDQAHEKNLKYFEDLINDTLKARQRARSHKEWHEDTVRVVQESVRLYCDVFRLTVPSWAMMDLVPPASASSQAA